MVEEVANGEDRVVVGPPSGTVVGCVVDEEAAGGAGAVAEVEGHAVEAEVVLVLARPAAAAELVAVPAAVAAAAASEPVGPLFLLLVGLARLLEHSVPVPCSIAAPALTFAWH